MKSIFSNWSKLSKHAGAMLMAPSMLAIAIVAFSFFSWNRQTVEEMPLLDLAMEIRIDLEHTNLLLFQIEKELMNLKAIKSDQRELDEVHDRLITLVDSYFIKMTDLKMAVASLQKGTTTMGSVTLSSIEVGQVNDEELNSRIELLATMIEQLDSHLHPELAGDAYQLFSYSMVDAALFSEAIRSAAVCDERVHALLQERLIVQQRLFLLLLVTFTLLAAFLYYKWRKLNREQENCLADIYLTSQATEQMGEPLLILSSKGLIEYGNHSYFKSTAFESKDVIGKPLSELITDSSVVDAIIERVQANSEWHGSCHLKDRQGEGYDTDLIASPILDRTMSPAFFLLRQRG